MKQMKRTYIFDEASNASKKKESVTYAYRISMIRDRAIRYERELSSSHLGANLVCKTITSCGQDDREQMIIVMLNGKNRVVGTNIVSVGSVRSATVFLRELFKPAITVSASAVIIGHNHPTGILDPSPEDILVTKRIIAVAKLLEIIVLDHVIVDVYTNNYFSFCDMGLLAGLERKASKMLDTLN